MITAFALFESVEPRSAAQPSPRLAHDGDFPTFDRATTAGAFSLLQDEAIRILGEEGLVTR